MQKHGDGGRPTSAYESPLYTLTQGLQWFHTNSRAHMGFQIYIDESGWVY